MPPVSERPDRPAFRPAPFTSLVYPVRWRIASRSRHFLRWPPQAAGVAPRTATATAMIASLLWSRASEGGAYARWPGSAAHRPCRSGAGRDCLRRHPLPAAERQRRHRRIALAYVTAMIVTPGVVPFVPATTLKFSDTATASSTCSLSWASSRRCSPSSACPSGASRVSGAHCGCHQIPVQLQLCRAADRGRQPVTTDPRFSIITQLTPATFWATFILANGLILSIAMVIVHRYLAVGDPLRRHAMRAQRSEEAAISPKCSFRLAPS